ncbi:hypothetical protein E2562_035112 [Oryza meyeriana var. granulata]|uniref:Uncharacterized protein n=1 Tax=Oryza meyeriana var. granulata TaxID=110450 RepID=A0A6G1FFU0_9ORYZ|nr:hypothetical protein E2562_035112 [Oryza meyeriana var. granulata]
MALPMLHGSHIPHTTSPSARVTVHYAARVLATTLARSMHFSPLPTGGAPLTPPAYRSHVHP